MRSLRPSLVGSKKVVKGRQVSFGKIVNKWFRVDTNNRSFVPSTTPKQTLTKKTTKSTRSTSSSLPSLAVTPSGVSPMRARRLFSKQRNYKKYLLCTALVLYTNTTNFQNTPMSVGLNMIEHSLNANTVVLSSQPDVSKLQKTRDAAKNIFQNTAGPALGRMWEDYHDHNTMLLGSDTSSFDRAGKNIAKNIEKTKIITTKVVLKTQDASKEIIKSKLLSAANSRLDQAGRNVGKTIEKTKNIATKALLKTQDVSTAIINSKFFSSNGRLFENYHDQNTTFLESDAVGMVDQGRKFFDTVKKVQTKAFKVVSDFTTNNHA